MKRWLPLAVLAATALACAGKHETGDTAPDVETQDTDPVYEECEEVLIDPIGPEPPRVGDTWIVWLRCDGATLLGWTVIRFDPVDFAEIEDNEVTFNYPGTAEMMVQVGSHRERMDVTVEP